MAAEWICDWCGRRTPAEFAKGRGWGKPAAWFQRIDEDGRQDDACSRACKDQIVEADGRTHPGILPL